MWPFVCASSAPTENFAINCIRNFLRLADALCASGRKARKVGRKETTGRQPANSLDLPAAQIDRRTFEAAIRQKLRLNHRYALEGTILGNVRELLPLPASAIAPAQSRSSALGPRPLRSAPEFVSFSLPAVSLGLPPASCNNHDAYLCRLMGWRYRP